MRDTVTHEQLSQRLRMSEQSDPMKELQVIEEEDPAKAAQPEDLMATSEVLSFNGIATLVPKGSVLKMPANLKNRTNYQAGARLVPWNEFFALNRGWITTTEVTFEQAAGREALSDALRKQIDEGFQVIVATLRQGPISVNPYTPPEEGGTTASR